MPKYKIYRITTSYESTVVEAPDKTTAFKLAGALDNGFWDEDDAEQETTDIEEIA